MTAINFKEAYNLFNAAHQKVWKHDRSKSLGASEVFGCLRKAWFSKHNYAKDADASTSWGALRRGDIIEEHFAEPGMRWYLETHFSGTKTRLIYGGKKQRTLIDEANHVSATPDGIVIDAPDDALEQYGIPSLGGTGCFMFEIKSVDPRVNLREEKSIHRGQTMVQMGLVRAKTRYKPNYAVILYVDASFLDDINVFVIPFDERTWEAAKIRSNTVFAETDPAAIMPEGKIDGACQYCPFKSACATASREATPTDGESNERNTPSPVMQEFERLLRDERRLSKEKKVSEQAHKEAMELVKELLRELGTKRVELPDGLKAALSWSKGRKTLDKQALIDAGIDLSLYEKEGEGFDTLRITERGPQQDET